MCLLIWGKAIHKGLIISSSSEAMKYLEPLSLCYLSDITILLTCIKSKETCCFEAWHFFSLISASPNFNIQSLIFTLWKKDIFLFCLFVFLFFLLLDTVYDTLSTCFFIFFHVSISIFSIFSFCFFFFF